MGSLRAVDSLQLPVRLHGIRLGQPVDLLVETESWHVLGFAVLCGDEATRFLPYGAAQPSDTEIAVGSALMLLDDVGFYRARGTSIRSLLGGAVVHGGRPVGTLRDLVLDGGHVDELEVERGSRVQRVPAAGSQIAPSRASAA
jgi:hypothetical protein